MKMLAAAAVAAAFLTCVPADAQTAGVSKDPAAYLETALKVLRDHHVNRARADWSTLERDARALARGAKTTADTYPAIRHVISALGERHTTLQPPLSRGPSSHAVPAPRVRSKPEARLHAGKYGYLRVTQVVGDREAGRPYAAELRDGVRALDQQGACGWIVDLRGNSGGNVWPMIDGVGALLGEPPFLLFDVPGQGRFAVLYKDGVAYQEGGAPPYAVEGFRPLRDPDAPVALLIDKDTASSAEALAVAFAGRPNVRRFGQPTADYITVNNPTELADGALLYLTVGWNMDRTGRRHTSAVQPDVATSTVGDAPIHAAASWLAATPACTG